MSRRIEEAVEFDARRTRERKDFEVTSLQLLARRAADGDDKAARLLDRAVVAFWRSR